MTACVTDVAFVVPLSSPAGLFGPSCELCAQLAVEEINARGGALGSELRLRIVDGGQSPVRVAGEVESLITRGAVHAVTGWHISAVRRELAPKTTGRVPYVYTPVYEGGERTPGVFLTGETPGQQVLPAMRWMAQELGIRSWCVVGADYVWPRVSAAVARRYASQCGALIADEFFLPLGTEEFGPALRRIERSRAQGVMMFLVGSDAAQFNRAFARRKLDDTHVRLSPLMDENMLLATGAASARGLYSAAGYFETLATADSLQFEQDYVSRFGADAPALSSPAESCYEGLMLLSELITRAGSLDVGSVCRAADALSYAGPRGRVSLRGNHLQQRVYIARASGLEFDVLDELPTMLS
jgi:ABC-type branched-subunit amino acid transport system substrate-binding protein